MAQRSGEVMGGHKRKQRRVPDNHSRWRWKVGESTKDTRREQIFSQERRWSETQHQPSGRDAGEDGVVNHPKPSSATNDGIEDHASSNTTHSSSPPDRQIEKLMSDYVGIPLVKTSLNPLITASKSPPSPSTVLALLLNALLSSAQISHELAAKTVAKVIADGYHDLPTLKKSSWH